MDRRVATFEAQTNAKLQDAINTWISRNKGVAITDIQYAIYPGHYTAYCALVLYHMEQPS